MFKNICLDTGQLRASAIVSRISIRLLLHYGEDVGRDFRSKVVYDASWRPDLFRENFNINAEAVAWMTLMLADCWCGMSKILHIPGKHTASEGWGFPKVFLLAKK